MDDSSVEAPKLSSETLHAKKKEIRSPVLLRFGSSSLLVAPAKVLTTEVKPEDTVYYETAALITDGKKSTQLREGPIQTIGRIHENNWVVGDPKASKHHAEISVKDFRVQVEDKGSLNGTKVQEIGPLPLNQVVISGGKDDAFILGVEPVILEIGGKKVLVTTSENGRERQFLSEDGKELIAAYPRLWLNNGFYQLLAGNGWEYPIDTGQGNPDEKQAEMIIFQGNVLWIKNTSSKQNIKIGYLDPKQAVDKKSDSKIAPEASRDSQISVDPEEKILEASKVRLHTGAAGLQHADELLKDYKFSEIQIGNLKFVLPTSKEFQDRLPKILEVMKKLDEVFAPYLTPAQPNQEASILLMPGKRYVPRAFANSSGIVMSFDVDNLGTFAHEYTHLRFRQSVGRTKTDMLAEGVAMYFGKKVVPNASSNDVEGCYGVGEIRNMVDNDQEIGISHTEVIQDAGIKPTRKEYEYAYGIGTHLATFLIEKFGVKTFVDIYKQTSADKMFDVFSGKPLIENGNAKGRQRDILANALRVVADQQKNSDLEPENIRWDFQVYMRKAQVRQPVLKRFVGFLLGAIQ